MALSKTATLLETIDAFVALSSAFGATDLVAVARRARTALEAAPGKSDTAKVAVLSVASALMTNSQDLVSSNDILTATEKLIYMCDPKNVGMARWKLAREAMAAAAKNSSLVEDVSKIQDPTEALMQAYVDRLTDPTLSLEDYPLVVEELLADDRLKATEQRNVIMRVTGYAKSLLGNNDNRRIALISWRRNKASDKYLFEARANEKRRF